jgi:hypothetical protein
MPSKKYIIDQLRRARRNSGGTEYAIAKASGVSQRLSIDSSGASGDFPGGGREAERVSRAGFGAPTLATFYL